MPAAPGSWERGKWSVPRDPAAAAWRLQTAHLPAALGTLSRASFQNPSPRGANQRFLREAAPAGTGTLRPGTQVAPGLCWLRGDTSALEPPRTAPLRPCSPAPRPAGVEVKQASGGTGAHPGLPHPAAPADHTPPTPRPRPGPRATRPQPVTSALVYCHEQLSFAALSLRNSHLTGRRVGVGGPAPPRRPGQLLPARSLLRLLGNAPRGVWLAARGKPGPETRDGPQRSPIRRGG
ncbi:translation initiation factor IF-2-like [Vulpes lagopus]|uniref:translation initiation factor IF-2-like n=1 Tax=Vulpes lagopus TaxID=494514 RepID=UPI001BC9ADF0|nr:translation initiation factor IF-2-like [Vulpes lagopus]